MTKTKIVTEANITPTLKEVVQTPWINWPQLDANVSLRNNDITTIRSYSWFKFAATSWTQDVITWFAPKTIQIFASISWSNTWSQWVSNNWQLGQVITRSSSGTMTELQNRIIFVTDWSWTYTAQVKSLWVDRFTLEVVQWRTWVSFTVMAFG